MKEIFKKYKYILLIIVLLVAGGLTGAHLVYHLPRSLPESPVSVSIPPGSSLQAISDSLYEKNIISDQRMFTGIVRILGFETKLQAGDYNIPESVSYNDLIYKLTHSQPNVVQVTVIEGLDVTAIARVMSKYMQFDSTEFMASVNDSALIADLDVPSESLEGFLFPDTYKFFENESPEAVIREMVGHFHSVIPDSFYTRAEELGWTIREAVTLASIIEGEAMIDDERPMVSSVYHNRLDRGMRLQADPTIQFIIEGPPRRLLNDDLEIDSPYNTYRYAGLPPGPINNPGFQSIKAALYPAESDYLYFVARGDGYHTFSETNREHVNAKRQLQELRRQVYLESLQQNQDNSL